VSLSTVYRFDRKVMHTGDLKYHRRALSDSNLPNLSEYQAAVLLWYKLLNQSGSLQSCVDFF
jgi:hypothetical protein